MLNSKAFQIHILVSFEKKNLDLLCFSQILAIWLVERILKPAESFKCLIETKKKVF